MNEVTMFHMLEPVLMDLYNAKERTNDKEKKRQIEEWIDTLANNPSLEAFETIIKRLEKL